MSRGLGLKVHGARLFHNVSLYGSSMWARPSLDLLINTRLIHRHRTSLVVNLSYIYIYIYGMVRNTCNISHIIHKKLFSCHRPISLTLCYLFCAM